MIDRVRYPDASSGGYSDADLIGFVGVDGSAQAVLRLDNGKYRTVSLLHIVRLANPLELTAEPAVAAAA